MSDLPERRRRFVEEYLRDLNGTQAAIRAGYSARTANEQAARLLANASVAQAVAEAKAERSARLGLTADRVLEEVAALAFAHMGQYATWQDDQVNLIDSGKVDPRAVAEVSQKVNRYGTNIGIKLHDKVASLKLLAQHLGIINERPGDQAMIQNVQVVVRPIDYYGQMTALGEPDEGDGD